MEAETPTGTISAAGLGPWCGPQILTPVFWGGVRAGDRSSQDVSGGGGRGKSEQSPPPCGKKQLLKKAPEA